MRLDKLGDFFNASLLVYAPAHIFAPPTTCKHRNFRKISRKFASSDGKDFPENVQSKHGKSWKGQQILSSPPPPHSPGAIASFPSDELCGIVPLGGFQTYSKMDAYRNRQKFNRHNNIIAREDERLLLKVHKGWRDFG